MRTTAGAIAAGITASDLLRELYLNPEDQALIDVSTISFIDILFDQFGPVLDLSADFIGPNNWPQIVADAHLANRQGDGSEAGAQLLRTLAVLSYTMTRFL